MLRRRTQGSVVAAWPEACAARSTSSSDPLAQYSVTTAGGARAGRGRGAGGARAVAHMCAVEIDVLPCALSMTSVVPACLQLVHRVSSGERLRVPPREEQEGLDKVGVCSWQARVW